MKRLPLLLILALGAGCSGAPLAPRPQSEVRAALDGLAGDYTRNRSDDFLARLDQDNFPNRGRFEQDLRIFLLRKRQIVLDLRPDPPISAGDRLNSVVNWNKTYMDETGTYKMEKGRCEMQFRRRPQGGWALVQIQGDSPF
jgi:hypothetical protein